MPLREETLALLAECPEPEDFFEHPEATEEQILEVKAEAWLSGSLRYLTRPGKQREMYDIVHGRDRSKKNLTPYVWNLHRRFGKTFLSVVFIVEYAIRRPGMFCVLLAETTKQANKILREHWNTIMRDCPAEMEVNRHEASWYSVRNPRWPAVARRKFQVSDINLYGVKSDRGEAARGGSADIVVMDECRNFRHLRYTWGQILLPMLKGRPDPLAIMMSTPADDPDHPWSGHYLPRAKAKGRYICCPAADNPDWDEDEDDAFAEEMGGRDSIEYRTEIQCEIIPNTEKLILPEFLDHEVMTERGKDNTLLVDDWELPEHFHALSVADFGGSVDHYGILTAIWDWEKGFLVILRELWQRDLDTGSLAALWKELEEDSWPSDGPQPKTLYRAADAKSRQRLTDLYVVHDLEVHLTDKQDRDANRRMGRTAVRKRQMRILRRCDELVYQLRHALRDPVTGKWDRTERMGHADLIAAFVAMWKIVKERDYAEQNPIPPEPVDPAQYWMGPTEDPGGQDRITWEELVTGRKP